jgi:hypothetical protein
MTTVVGAIAEAVMAVEKAVAVKVMAKAIGMAVEMAVKMVGEAIVVSLTLHLPPPAQAMTAFCCVENHDETFLYLVEPRQKLCSERLAGAARLALSRPKPQAPRTRAGAAQAREPPRGSRRPRRYHHAVSVCMLEMAGLSVTSAS